MGRVLKRLWPLVGLALVLSGCGKAQQDPVQEALDFRTALLGAENCSFLADVSADFGEKVYHFSLDCVYNPADDEAELTVTAPESIAGIAATVAGEDAQVQYEDVELVLGTGAGGHIAPMRLPQLLGSAWTGGYVESQAKDGDGWLVTYRVPCGQEELLLYTWFTEQMVPTAAELYDEDICVLQAGVENFSMA